MIRFATEFDANEIEEFVRVSEKATVRQMHTAVTVGAMHLVSAVKARLAGSRAGRTYFVPGVKVKTLKSGDLRGRTYRAAALSEAPASATGKLRQAVDRTPTKVNGNEVSAQVGVDGKRIPYARRQEFGGVHVQKKTVSFPIPGVGWRKVKAGTVIRTQPRPYIRPTFDEERSKVTEAMSHIIGDVGLV